MSRPSNILLISYVFPPHYGIGGRRWAKFAKELAGRGINVHVLFAKNPYDEDSIWTRDVSDNEHIKMHPLPLGHPVTFIKSPATFPEKLAYRFWLIFARIFIKGAIFDRGIFWKRHLLPEAERLIRQYDIHHVITTGAPFRAMYFSTELKKKHPEIQLISDLRDAWTWSEVWGFGLLTKKQMAHELYKENEVIKHSDVVTVPATSIEKILRNKYQNSTSKIKLIPHCYDPEDFSPVQKRQNAMRKKIIFFGTIYQKTEHYLYAFAEALNNSENFDLTLHMYTNDWDKLAKLPNENERIHKYKQIPTRQLFEQLVDADMILILCPDYGINDISTKYYEIIYARIPILLISNKGYLSNFITQNGLGIHITPDEIISKLPDVLNNRYTFEYNTNFRVDQYSLSSTTDQLLALLK